MKPSINNNKRTFSNALTFIFLFAAAICSGQNITLTNNIYYPGANMDSNANTSITTSSELIALANNNTISDASAFSTRMAETTLFAVEIEQEQNIEEWMLSSFNTKKSSTTANIELKSDLEAEMPIESWMTDLSGW